MIPFTSIKPVINHCAVVSVMFNPFIIAGNAVFKIVWFNIATNALISITNTMVLRLAVVISLLAMTSYPFEK